MQEARKFFYEALRIPRGILDDFKKYPFRDFLWRMYSLREAWYEKGTKRLVGEDSHGNKYWETDSPTELSLEFFDTAHTHFFEFLFFKFRS